MEPRYALSTLPTADVTPSLADYLARSPELGPGPPAESASNPAADAPSVLDASLGIAGSLAGSDSSGGFAADGTLTAPLDTGAGDPNVTLTTGTTSGNGDAAENRPPVIASLSITIDGGELVIQGSLTDESRGTCTVRFNDLISATATPDEQGRFVLRVQLPLLSGYLHAVATDEYGGESNVWTEWVDV